MRIEPADADDVDAVVDQWVELAREQRDHGSHILPEPNRERIRETFLRRTLVGELLVARDGDRTEGGDSDREVVGFVAFRTEPGGFEVERQRGVVSNVYVRPGDRDRGIGSRLLAAAESRLREAGVDAVALEAMADNEAARRFYRRQGYDLHRVEFEKSLDEG